MDQESSDTLVKDVILQMIKGFNGTIDFLQEEFSKLQVGRAHPGLVDYINIEVYGAMQSIKSIASITIPEPKQIMIQPWDKNLLGPIEKVIRSSDLGLNPINDGVSLRLVLPELTEERRRDLVKVVNKLTEESRIRIRQYRHNAFNKLKQFQKDKLISEDKLKWEEGNIKKELDKVNLKLDEISKKKQESIMKV